MEIKTLYKYTRPDGGTTVSPVKPEGEFEENFRLIADEGMALTKDGVNYYDCIDVDSTDGWKEVEYQEEDTGKI